MSIQTQINRLSEAKTTLRDWMSQNGFTVTDDQKLDGLCTLLASLELTVVRSGSSEPSDSVGANGDLYLVLEG